METDLNTLITDLDTVTDTDDNTIPQWARVLIKSMKGLLTVIKNYDELSLRVEILESNKAVCENSSTLLTQENIRLNELIQKLEVRIDDHEQRSRNACLLIHGVEESGEENTDDVALKIMNNELGFKFEKYHIQRSHRLGVKKQARNTRSNKVNPRPIIIKFTNYCDRRAVFVSKKKLKGQPISISENLTKTRYVLLKAATLKLGKGKVWSNDGRIMTKMNDRYINISSIEDLNGL
jgi:hypothetical protein